VAASSRIEQHLGEKLSILFRIEGDPEHPYSEVVGLLQRVTVDEAGARTLAVCRRDGSVVEVAEADVILLWKIFHEKYPDLLKNPLTPEQRADLIDELDRRKAKVA